MIDYPKDGTPFLAYGKLAWWSDHITYGYGASTTPNEEYYTRGWAVCRVDDFGEISTVTYNPYHDIMVDIEVCVELPVDSNDTIANNSLSLNTIITETNDE